MAMLFVLAGCAADSDLGLVSGTVTLDEQPLKNAQVEFIPEGDSGSTSYGRTDDQGRYEMEFSRNTSGASIGVNQVRITTADMDVDENERMVRVPEKVPARYNVKTELRFEVEPGRNTADFDLKSGGEVVDDMDDVLRDEG